MEGFNEQYLVARAMQKHGGSFVSSLGKALEKADATNFKKIKKTWPAYYKKYLIILAVKEATVEVMSK